MTALPAGSAATFVVRSVAAFVLASLATAFAVAVVPGLVGGPRPIVIETGSMAPALAPGDVVLVADATGASGVETLRAGSIVTFEDPDGRGIVTHRVVDHAGGRLVTKGDANRTPDVAEVRPADVVGVAVVRVPFVGRPALWVAQHRWGRVAAGAAFVALAIEAVRSPRSRRGGRRPVPSAPDSADLAAAGGAPTGVTP